MRWTSALAALAAALITLAGCSEAPPPDRGTGRDPLGPIAAEQPLATGRVYSATATSSGGQPLPAAPGGAAPIREREELGSDQLVLACDRVTTRLLEPLEYAFEQFAPQIDLSVVTSAGRSPLEKVARGEAHAAIVAVSGLEQLEDRSGLTEWPVADHILALGIHPDVNLPNIAGHELRRLLTGETRHWSWLGSNAGHISLVLPQPGADAGLVGRLFAPGDALTDRALQAMNEMQAVDRLSRLEGGVAVVSLAALRRAPDTRVVAIDGLVPNVPAFRSGAWPYGVPVRLVCRGYPAGDVETLRTFFRTDAADTSLGDLITLRR